MFSVRSYILLLVGIGGIALFFLLRPHIDINAGGPVSQSKSEIQARMDGIGEKLGFDSDTLSTMFIRQQHQGYLKDLEDTLRDDFSIERLNANDVSIQSWLGVVGRPIADQAVITGIEDIYDASGLLKMRFNNSGEVIRIYTNSEFQNPTFIPAGDSVMATAEMIVSDIFGYDLSAYELVGDDQVNEGPGQELDADTGELLNESETAQQQDIRFHWVKRDASVDGPADIRLDLGFRDRYEASTFRTEWGFTINEFIATDPLEPVTLANGMSADSGVGLFTYLFFASMFVLVTIVFSVGLHALFKGQVEWRRSVLIFIGITLGVYGWRAFYNMNTFGHFLDNSGIFITELNNAIFALVMGLYSAMAYIGWEAYARKHQHGQIELVDALWRRMFFIRETGAGLIHGVAAGGLAIGAMSLFSYLTGEVIVQADSQFGFAEASIDQRLLTLNMSAWTTTWLICFAQIGLVYGFVERWIKNQWVHMILSIIMITIFITFLGRLVGTTGSTMDDLLIYLSIGTIFYMVYRNYGLLSVTTGWWFFSVFFLIIPYIGSPSIEYAYVWWVQVFLMAGPLIYGFISYRYGDSISEVSGYIPEYEERIAQQLRMEKEIEIARESQYKLMPLKPPVADGIDIYGFFLPSFEVGGDYYDYVLSHDEEGKPEAVTMAVVDVSGKAMRAAMPAIFTSGLLLSRMKEDLPADILKNVSEPIFTRTDKRTFITCLIARYDLKDKTLSVANAGHCRPVLKRSGTADFIQTPAPHYPLGMYPCVEYQAHDFKMKKGDLLLLYSDGLPEAVDKEGRRYGFEEVPRMLEQIDTENMSAQEIAQDIKKRVQKFSDYQLADDTTIICLKV